jgi:xylulokinase
MSLLLGIDIGTSSAKAVVFDADAARIVGTAAHEYPVLRPAPDRAEQNPDDWWQAVQISTRAALAHAADAGFPADRVAGIGFSGQMHGAVFLGKDHTSTRPAIIWADQRSGREAAGLAERIGPAHYTAIAGTLPAAGFMGATLAWLAAHEPDALRGVRCIVLPKDYVRLKMTGETGTDPSDAAGTGLFDIALRVWSAEIVGAVGISRQFLPTLTASSAVVGGLLAEAADALGLRPGIPVVTGCADQPAQAVGNGLLAPGRASITLGSGGQVFMPVRPQTDGDHFAPLKTDPRLHVFNHAAYHTWYILGAILSAGLSLRWLRGITGLEGQADAYATFSREAAPLAPGADGLLFLPYLAGERTPHMDPAARGGFIGLSAAHTRGHLARAVMEGVAFAMRQAFEISLSLGGSASLVIASGGGMESAVWRGIMADVLGVPLQQTAMHEQAGVGAALLAGVGAGVYASLDAACAASVRLGTLTEPDPARHTAYERLYHQFTSLYPRLKSDFHQLSAR